VRPLAGVRVVELSVGIAGAYCTKLLADAGAEVVKVEPDGGDPLRRWSASGAAIPPGEAGALYRHLARAKRVAGADELDGLLAGAACVVWSPGGRLAPAELRAAHPHLVVTTLTPFGLDGPWHDKPATELTLQAWSGGIVGLGRGYPDRPPVQVGGRVGEWLAGAYAAIGTLAALRSGAGELVDVSVLEVLACCLTYYPVTYKDQLGQPMRKRRFVPTPGVAAARDGLVGLGCGTGQQWLDFCVMVGHPEWQEEPRYFVDRTSLAPVIEEWVGRHSVEEVLSLAAAFRIPHAPIVNGANATGIDHFRARGSFVTYDDGTVAPGPPYRVRPTSSGHHRPTGRPTPFESLRVLDMTSYWAGPLVGQTLALLGAEVVHLESPTRPDGARLIGGVPTTEDRYWERGPIFNALNTNKKSLAVDAGDPRGRELIRRFVATCDVVVENFTPRVIEQLGLTEAALREVRPDLIMVRMPGFGLDGPWRDDPAFAFVIEDASGLTWLTGYPDRLPIEPYTLGDPNASLHALVGLLVALEHRDRTGEGSLVEAAMIDAALSITAEQVIEYSAYGALLERSGNRSPGVAPQGVYRTADVDERGRADTYVAISVADDAQWEGLRQVLGWPHDPSLATVEGRLADHDRLDAALADWCGGRGADEIVELLWSAGVAVAKVMPPHEQPRLPQLQHRRFFEELDHPVAGRARYSTWPLRFASRPGPVHRCRAPLLGEHNAELLGEIGVSDDELVALEAAGVIGRAVRSG
jgi:crotonobetainyl-CoA:carnitine CoA-transferase CaiB-like acyl-CoA transferase